MTLAPFRGFSDMQPRSLAAVGEAPGVSRERIRQLESPALCELREERGWRGWPPRE